MRIAIPLALVASATSASALVLPAQDALLAALDWARPKQPAAWPGFCSLRSNGHDDTQALSDLNTRCGKNGMVDLPSKEYIITKPLTLALSNGYLSLGGWITYTAAELPEGTAALTLGGANIAITAKNGGVRVTSAKAEGYALHVKAANSAVTGFSVESSGPGILVADVSNTDISDPTVNAASGVVITRASNMAINGLVYTGVGDCVSVQAGTANTAVADAECHGAGVAIDAAGEDVQIRNVAIGGVRVLPLDGAAPAAGVRFQSTEDAWGQAANISIGGLEVQDAGVPIALEGANSAFSFHHVNVTDVSGTAGGAKVVQLHCSPAAPCHHWRFKHVDVKAAEASRENYVCDNVPGVHVHHGAWECLPSQ